MKLIYILILILIFSFTNLVAQEKTEQDIDYAYKNAMKGIYWALSNIPDKKSKIESDLIADDKLYAEVKLYKEVNGVRVKSTGFYHSNEVRIKIYKSYDNLEKDGYLKKTDEVE